MTRSGGGAMPPLEDRVRDAIQAKAAEVPPGAVPPLRLPGRHRSPPSLAHGGQEEGGPAKQTRGGRAWAAPLAAAVGVAAAVALVFTAAGLIHPGRPANDRPAGLATLPRYYVALTYTGSEQCCEPGKPYSPVTKAVLRVTATGQTLATIEPPRPYGTFVAVTAAGDDRTFVLAAQPHERLTQFSHPPVTKFFLLRISPGRRDPVGRARLTPLPIPVFPSGVSDFALSPDGSHLAVLGGIHEGPDLSVFDVDTGAARTWSAPDGVGNGKVYNQESLSWGADNRTLAFLYAGGAGRYRGGVRLLDTARSGGDLLADSRFVVGQPSGPGSEVCWIQAQLTPDGRTVIANRNRNIDQFSQQLAAFSVRTGKVVRVISTLTWLYGDDEQVHWMSPSGNVLIVTDALPVRHSLATSAALDAGVLSSGHYRPLPWSENTFTAAW